MATLPSQPQPQWLRKFSLIVADSDGNGLDLSNLQVRFTVTSAVLQTPRKLEARIYNLAPSTAAAIQQEFTQVQVMAGYQDDPYGLIFTGTICQTRRGRESAADSYLDILAGDGDVPYNTAAVQQTVAAGWTWADIQKHLVDSFGLMMGHSPELQDTKGTRAKTLYGATKDLMRMMADSNGLDWHIEGGQVNFVPKGGYIPGDAVVLSAASGMIGVPEQTIDGVTVKCLLNPNIKTGRLLQIADAAINATSFITNVGTVITRLPDLDTAGTYMAYSIRHEGDTRGQAWYTYIICNAQNPTNIPVSSQTYLQAVIDGN